ncbi:carboxypeptidase-like regulatory domain-containing protein [candidate division KSB1 bacterium]
MINIISLLLTLQVISYAQFNGEINFDDDKRVPPSLLKVISVDLEYVTFEKALNVISDNAGAILNYSGDYIPLMDIVSVKFHKVPAIQALMKVLMDTDTGLKITRSGLLAIVPAKDLNPVIKGTVVEKATGMPLSGANVVVIGTSLGSATDENGEFHINGLSPGVYSLAVSYSGYKRNKIEHAIIEEENPSRFYIELSETVTPLDEIIVTPGYFSKTENSMGSDENIKADDLRNFPHFSEDIFLSLKRLSGFSGDDFSAKFGVRGGEQDEVLMLFDGLELYDPFHLKDFGGILSIIDMEAVGSVDVLTGGYPAEYGKRKSGVVNIKSESGPIQDTKTSMGLSILNGRILSEGPINGDSGRWLFSARKGLIDYALRINSEDDELHPDYYDVLGKMNYKLNENHTLSAHFMRAGDKLRFIDDDNDNSDSSYDDLYAWMNLNSYFNENLYAHTTLSSGLLNYDRSGVLSFPETDYEDEDFRVDDYRSFKFLGIKQDWDYKISENYFLKSGFELKELSSEYDYYSTKVKTVSFFTPALVPHYEQMIDTTSAKIKSSGREFGMYFSNKIKIASPFIIEAGLRYDRHSYINSSTISPRINMAYFLGNSTVLKAAWGRFYQTQGIHELNIQDKDLEFHDPEKSEHIILGMEHRFENGINFKLSSYWKFLTNLRPRYKNIYNAIDVFPEASGDRMPYQPEKGEASGFEFFLRRESGTRLSWWASYVYSYAIDHFKTYRVRKFSDQTHTVDLNFNYKHNKDWGLNVSWLYHTGWPYTKAGIEYDKNYIPGLGEIDYTTAKVIPHGYNRYRLPAYHRLDVRLLRNFSFREGRLGIFFEVINAYNRHNIRNVEYSLGNDSSVEGPAPVARRIDHYWMGILPSFGINWDF